MININSLGRVPNTAHSFGIDTGRYKIGNDIS